MTHYENKEKEQIYPEEMLHYYCCCWLWCHLILGITFRHEVYQWGWVFSMPLFE